MEKREQMYEGKAKKVYATDDPNLVIRTTPPLLTEPRRALSWAKA